MKKSRFISCLLFSALLLCVCALAQESGSVELSSEQMKQIRSELNAIRNEANLLKMQSENLKADSAHWKSKCAELEEKLNLALQMSESSEASVIELQEQVRILRKVLAELRTEYDELSKSYMRQKKNTTAWMTTAIVLGAVAVTEGIFIFITNK